MLACAGMCSRPGRSDGIGPPGDGRTPRLFPGVRSWRGREGLPSAGREAVPPVDVPYAHLSQLWPGAG